eukprot:5531825-Lingulodinium_polyedra.AAC.1
MVVDAWSAYIAKCAAPQQWNALLSAFLSSFRARVAQACVQTCIRSPRRRAYRNSRIPCVNDHVVAGAR